MIPKILSAVALLAFTALPSDANPCVAVRSRVVVQRRAVVAAAVVTPVAVAVAVPVPLYSVGLNYGGSYGYGASYDRPNMQPQQQQGGLTQEQAKQLQALFDEVVRLRTDVNSMKGQPAPQVVPLPPGKEQVPSPPVLPVPKQVDDEQAMLKVFNAKCASCHDSGVADKKGGPNKFALLNGGKLAALSDGQKWKTISKIVDGSMPKGGQALPDNEIGDVLVGLK